MQPAVQAQCIHLTSPEQRRIALVKAHTMAGGKKCVEDEEALKLMHQNVAAALADASSSAQQEAFGGSLPLPNVWVSRWVDYSKKYGLGYKLSNNQYGVFFNDATKILLKTDGERSVRLDYIIYLNRSTAC